ncbi:MAG: flavodoxin domain-containing protein [Candidatus Goldbacteria bacterium]|nr:flavodoxin domain-containing protein [Candidatus Goldiibacteriota bacterium]
MKKIIMMLLGIMIFSAAQAKDANVKNILIVYGSFMGSTQETAEFMAKELKALKHNVKTVPAASAAEDISKYDLLILGSAIHGGAPHPDMTKYVADNYTALTKAKAAVFIQCATITSAKEYTREKAKRYPQKVAIGFTPVSTAVFGGLVTEPKNGFEKFMGKLILGLEKYGDFRNWDEIKKWTLSLVEL